MEPVRWGILSTGRINRLAILEPVSQTERAEVVAVASRDQQRADEYAREHGIERAHGSYEALLDDPDVEAVYISLPNSMHAEWSIRALEAGKHVLSEKPLTRDPREAERAFDAAERTGRTLMEGFMYRHHPQTKRLAQLVRDGELGELRLVRSHFSFTLDRPRDVRWDSELGGGSLLDLGCYCTNLMRTLAGEPDRVYAEQITAPSAVDVRFAATLRFARGVLGHFDCAFDLPRRIGFEAVGSEGSATMLQPFAEDQVTLEVRRGDELVSSETETANRYGLEVDNFARAIAGEEPPLLDRHDSIGQARALDALLRSAESAGTAVTV